MSWKILAYLTGVSLFFGGAILLLFGLVQIVDPEASGVVGTLLFIISLPILVKADEYERRWRRGRLARRFRQKRLGSHYWPKEAVPVGLVPLLRATGSLSQPQERELRFPS